MQRFLNRMPTITIREGDRVKVYLTSDIELPVFSTRPNTIPLAVGEESCVTSLPPHYLSSPWPPRCVSVGGNRSLRISRRRF